MAIRYQSGSSSPTPRSLVGTPSNFEAWGEEKIKRRKNESELKKKRKAMAKRKTS
jgi:hypothetical protein